MTFGKSVLQFYKSLRLTIKLPEGVEVLNPYQDKDTFRLCEKFYTKFYNDHCSRTLILGINPGRFGAGITGIPFTDPVKLENQCGIPNDLKKKVELSADFIYTLVDAYGGPEKFYSVFYIGAVSPLGFVTDGKNLNYYDDKILQRAVEPFILQCIQQQLAFGINRERCYCLGEGKNFDYLSHLNKAHHFFNEIVPLAHPRFIMQYRRKSVQTFVDLYLEKLKVSASTSN